MATQAHPDRVITTTIVASDASITTQPTLVHWLTVSNSHATNTAAVELNDSTDDSGTDRWGIVLSDVDGGGASLHAVFDPPIPFAIGVRADITGGTVQLIVGVQPV